MPSGWWGSSRSATWRRKPATKTGRGTSSRASPSCLRPVREETPFSKEEASMSEKPEAKPQNKKTGQTSHATGRTSAATDRPSNTAGQPSNTGSGQPGDGKGRTDPVGTTPVYPGSGPWPTGDVEIRTPASFVEGQYDEQGRQVEGGSEAI